jgi:hypothetical protein
MWTIVCLLFFLSLFDLCPSVCWFLLHKCCLPTFPLLIGSQIVIVFSTCFIFCSRLNSNQITSIQSLYNYEFWLCLCKIVRSTVILLLLLFIITSHIESSNIKRITELTKQSPLILKSLTTIKTRTYNVVNPGTGLGQAQVLVCGYYEIVEHHTEMYNGIKIQTEHAY